MFKMTTPGTDASKARYVATQVGGVSYIDGGSASKLGLLSSW